MGTAHTLIYPWQILLLLGHEVWGQPVWYNLQPLITGLASRPLPFSPAPSADSCQDTLLMLLHVLAPSGRW